MSAPVPKPIAGAEPLASETLTVALSSTTSSGQIGPNGEVIALGSLITGRATKTKAKGVTKTRTVTASAKSRGRSSPAETVVLSRGAIAGIVVGCFAAVLLVWLLIFLRRRRRARQVDRALEEGNGSGSGCDAESVAAGHHQGSKEADGAEVVEHKIEPSHDNARQQTVSATTGQDPSPLPSGPNSTLTDLTPHGVQQSDPVEKHSGVQLEAKAPVSPQQVLHTDGGAVPQAAAAEPAASASKSVVSDPVGTAASEALAATPSTAAQVERSSTVHNEKV